MILGGGDSLQRGGDFEVEFEWWKELTMGD